ncbi:uncharacterized protein LOC123547114 [Mercenaria mercenaria]|uniref:uncharacterized protein LOC123547114 n=1 Tax=Mercenaria mercenaria TaxID=6596 RepID=UPI00234FA6A8|nr:uncharacterized protein LOC123547114 [Mercenaria mercenaria]
MSVVHPSTQSVIHMKSEFKQGSQIATTQWCTEAPVLSDRLYNVFRFSTDLRIEIYGESVYIQQPTSGEMLCLVLDVTDNDNGTAFLLIPEDLSKHIDDLTVYLRTKHHPRGVGISMGEAIHVNDEHLSFWNGYKAFTPTLPYPKLWVGSYTEISMFIMKFEGKESYFKSASSTETLLSSVDPYSSISTLDVTVAPSFDIHVLGKAFTETLGMLSFDIDLYRNEQGFNQCDENIVPDGLYFSLKTTVDPFKNVPILRHWSPYQDPAQVIDVLIGCRWTEPSQINISSFLTDLNETIGDLLAMQDEVKFSDLPDQLFQKVIIMQSAINKYYDGLYGAREQRMFLQNIWFLYKNIKRQVTLLHDTVEFSVSQTTDAFMTNVSENIEKVKKVLNDMIKRFYMQTKSLSTCTSLGLRYSVDISMFFGEESKIKLGWFNIEVFYSENMLQCSRFDAVSKLLNGQASLRVIGQASRSKSIGRFLDLEIGGGIGLAMSLEKYTAVMQFNSFIKILGVVCTVDTLVTFEGIFVYYETNIWNTFFSQIDVIISHNSFNNLLFDVNGRFVANDRKKRQTQTRTDSFSGSYISALKKLTNMIADKVNTRITLVQNSFTDAQTQLTKAQASLNKMEGVFLNMKESFDKAEAALAVARRKVDETRKPYLRAIEELNRRKIKVKNLCRIRKCDSFCIPGIRCKICSKKIWFARVYYPCCYFTRCMFRIPDPVCIIRNIACMIIRTIAFAALEAAKIFVRTAMIPFDIANLALTAAEFVLEKSRLSLEIAEHVFDLANAALEMVKISFEMIKVTLEAVKEAVRVAATVAQMIIEHGLQKIVDVRNCGFNVQISDRDLPIFYVYCDINLFRMGWMKVEFPINFLHPYLSIYHAAKATVKTAMRILKRRRKRSASFKAFSIIFDHLRRSRSDDIDIVYINESLGFEYNASTDYDYRTKLFAEKCRMIVKIEDFMSTSFEYLYTLANDSNEIYNIADQFEADISLMDINTFTANLSFENMGVSRDYAQEDYNLTDGEIDAAEEEAKNEVMNNSIINDFNARVNASRENTAAELNNIESVDFSTQWMALMNGVTKQFFEEDICAGFQDCILHCFTELYDLYEEEEVPNVALIQDAIMQLDENVTSMFLNTNVSIKEMVSTMKYVVSTLELVTKLNPFCAIPPTFRLQLNNITAVVGSEVVFPCDAIGDPEPDVWWYKDGDRIPGQHMAYLIIPKITPKDEGVYYCEAGNVVANLSSNEAHLFVIEFKGRKPVVDNINAFVYVFFAVAAVVLICIVVCCMAMQKAKIRNQNRIRDKYMHQESVEVQEEKSIKTTDVQTMHQDNSEIGSKDEKEDGMAEEKIPGLINVQEAQINITI